MRYLERKTQFKTVAHDDSSNLFDMNGDWIVHNPDGRIAVRNRWTLEIEKVRWCCSQTVKSLNLE